MILIWGSRFMKGTVNRGQFYCPGCDRENVDYRHRKGRNWFTLYFIPIFPIESSTEYIECSRCAGTFKTEVLEMAPPSPVDRLARTCMQQMQQGDSYKKVHDGLCEDGLPQEKATAFLNAIVGEQLWSCDHCSEQYLEGINKCRGCSRKRPRA